MAFDAIPILKTDSPKQRAIKKRIDAQRRGGSPSKNSPPSNSGPANNAPSNFGGPPSGPPSNKKQPPGKAPQSGKPGADGELIPKKEALMRRMKRNKGKKKKK